MPYKKGDKFTVEITEVLTGDDGRLAYRLNDMPNLVVDVNQLNDMKPEESAEPGKKSSFERVPYGFEYYFVNGEGAVLAPSHLDSDRDKARYNAANYCTDKSLMEQRALHETLNRLLWRYSEEHGGDPEWDGEAYHWYIYCTSNGGLSYTNVWSAKIPGIVYFGSKQIADSAINDIIKPFLADHPDFVW